MDQDQGHAFLYYRSPEDIRSQEFAHRMRGIDADEVYEFLDLLADQVSSTEVERAEQLREAERLRQENEQLRAEVDRLRGEVGSSLGHAPVPAQSETQAQAAALLAQAQQVADQLVEEAVQHAQTLMSQARHQQPLDTAWRSDPGSSHTPPPAPGVPEQSHERSTDADDPLSGPGYGGTSEPSTGGVERTFTYRRRTWS